MSYTQFAARVLGTVLVCALGFQLGHAGYPFLAMLEMLFVLYFFWKV